MPAAAPAGTRHAPHGGLAALTVGALGIVYGDIGTSPLYAMDQIFLAAGSHGRADVLGAASLVIWVITLIVSIKYAMLVLRAQNGGEGGVFALYALLHEGRGRTIRTLLWALILGAGLLFGDGMITPAISVLSAVEGLQVAAPALASLVLPVTLALLLALFGIQCKGTAGIGRVFGPVMFTWFAALALLGAWQVARHPAILAAFDPRWGLAFLAHVGWLRILWVLGALMLVVTGGEAMYADVGHFGTVPIRMSWFGLVYPALLLNYLGQGAYLLCGGAVVGGKIFYSIVPQSMVIGMVVLATAATVVASQALISGAFSQVSQAVRLGLFPRIGIQHTHATHAGQVYVPAVNWMLLGGCVALVVAFRTSAALAAAYGLEVAAVMLITSVAMIPVARQVWGWNRWSTHLVWSGFSALNAGFLLASATKFVHGAWVPMSVGLFGFSLMGIWRWGRKATAAAYASKSRMRMSDVVALHRASTVFIERNALVMSPTPVRALDDGAPALVHMLWERGGLLPRNLILVEVAHRDVPYIRHDRYRVTVFERDGERGSIIAVELSFGFMEDPNVEALLADLARHRAIDLPPDPRQWVVYVAHEHLLPARSLGPLRRLRLGLFGLLRALSRPAYDYYRLGDKVHLSAEILPVRVG